MNTFKGTPGPWKVKHSESKAAWNVIGTQPGGKYKIARCPYIAKDHIEPSRIIDRNAIATRESNHSKANAQLIACAPEMLEMLEEIYNYDGKLNADRYKRLTALIQKATTI